MESDLGMGQCAGQSVDDKHFGYVILCNCLNKRINHHLLRKSHALGNSLGLHRNSDGGGWGVVCYSYCNAGRHMGFSVYLLVTLDSDLGLVTFPRRV